MFHTIRMHQFAWKEGGNFFNLLQKEELPRKGGGGFQPWRKLSLLLANFLSYFEKLFDDVHIFQPAFTYIHHFITVNDWLGNFN